MTGFSEETVKKHFKDWNELPRTDVETIATRHGTTVKDGGFQAYLVEQTP